MARHDESVLKDSEDMEKEYGLLKTRRSNIVTQQEELAMALQSVDETMLILKERMRAIRVRPKVAAKAGDLTGCTWRIRIGSSIVGRGDITCISLNILVPPRVRRAGHGEYFKFPGSIWLTSFSWDRIIVDPDFIGDDGKVRFFFHACNSDGVWRAVCLAANTTGTKPIEFLGYDTTAASSAGRTLGLEDVGGVRCNVI